MPDRHQTRKPPRATQARRGFESIPLCPAQLAGVVTLLCCATVAIAACGDSEGVAFEKGGRPAPRSCLERWNADQGATTFGTHAYLGHKSRAAQVFRVAESQGQRPRGCAVVFAVSESDREYGTVGEVSLSAGWELMNSFPVLGDPAEAQRRASSNANASLNSDGRLAPLD
jgi:hypothetical protein